MIPTNPDTTIARPSDLVVEGLSVWYAGMEVVRGVSFVARAGEILGLLGPSGAGKSSILAALTGVAKSSGVIRQGETVLSSLPARRRGLGHVYQEFRLFEWMSIWDNVAFPCRANGWSESEIKPIVSQSLNRVGLRIPPEHSVRQLSGGERQRVALARAMAFRPRALLLDEPFSHLDPPLREELKVDLIRFLTGSPVPIILVTHDYAEAFELCDRIAIVIDGQLIQSGQADDLQRSPATLDVARLLGYSNSLHGTVYGVDGNHVSLSVGLARHSVKARYLGSRPIQAARACAVCRPESVRILSGSGVDSNELPATVIESHTALSGATVMLRLSDSEFWTVKSQGALVPAGRESVLCAIAPDELLVFADQQS